MHLIQLNSPNFDKRPDAAVIDHIILHYTEISFEETISKFCDSTQIVSAHYVIREDGQIFEIVPTHLRARHAGVSHFRKRSNFNDFSIGIEIANSGKEEFTEVQMISCIDLCLDLQQKYDIPSENILGHSDIGPDRKVDPGLFFDWELLRRYNLGIPLAKLNDDSNLDQIIFSKGDQSEKILTLQQKLAKFGYNILATGIFDKQTSDVVRAYQSHFSKESILSRYDLTYYQNLSNYFVWDNRSEQSLNYNIFSNL